MEEEKTQSGIENWHLGVPTWAEGAKPSFMKSRRKTMICQQWLDARKDRKAPQGAPPWWGCPRGRGCDFAHGKVGLPFLRVCWWVEYVGSARKGCE